MGCQSAAQHDRLVGSRNRGTQKPFELIGWRSLADRHIANAGSVRFRTAPGGRGTEVQVSLEYVPPAGQLGAAVARLLGEEPQVQIDEDLKTSSS